MALLLNDTDVEDFSRPLTSIEVSAPRIAAKAVQLRSGNHFIGVSTDIRDVSVDWPVMAALNTTGAQGYAFQCRDHLECWLDTIGAAQKIRPLFVTVTSKSGAPLMMLPLGVRQHRGIRILSLLDSGVSDYNAPLLFEGAADLSAADFGSIWRTICHAAQPYDVAVLDKIAESVGGLPNPLLAFAPDRCPVSGHVFSLSAFHNDPSLRRKRDFQDSRRKRKRIAEVGELMFRVAQEPAEIEQVFEVFVRQKSRRYMETLGHPGFDVPGQRAYYLELVRRYARSSIELAYLTVNDQVIATALGFIAGSRYYYMMAAYEAGPWFKYSPGRLLLEELVERAHARGIEDFDLGLGDEAYKSRWPCTELPLWSGIHPRTAAGKAYFAAIRARRMAKKYFQILRSASSSLFATGPEPEKRKLADGDFR